MKLRKGIEGFLISRTLNGIESMTGREKYKFLDDVSQGLIDSIGIENAKMSTKTFFKILENLPDDGDE